MTSFPSPMHSATALKISLSPFLSSCPPMMMRGPCRSVMVHQSLEFLCLQRAARLVEPTSSDCHGKMPAVVGNATAALAIDPDHASFSAGPFNPFNCALSNLCGSNGFKRLHHRRRQRPEESRGGTECVSPGRSWCPHKHK